MALPQSTKAKAEAQPKPVRSVYKVIRDPGCFLYGKWFKKDQTVSLYPIQAKHPLEAELVEAVKTSNKVTAAPLKPTSAIPAQAPAAKRPGSSNDPG